MREAFDAEQQATLAAVLDTIIPPSADGRLPGAGELGLATHVERGLAQVPALLPVIAQGLDSLDGLALQRDASSFVALLPGERSAVLAELAAAQPGFLGPIVFHTYVGYYQHPRALAAVGLEPRPPHPKGHALEPGDFGLLDAVRSRGPIYRAG